MDGLQVQVIGVDTILIGLLGVDGHRLRDHLTIHHTKPLRHLVIPKTVRETQTGKKTMRPQQAREGVVVVLVAVIVKDPYRGLLVEADKVALACIDVTPGHNTHHHIYVSTRHLLFLPSCPSSSSLFTS